MHTLTQATHLPTFPPTSARLSKSDPPRPLPSTRITFHYLARVRFTPPNPPTNTHARTSKPTNTTCKYTQTDINVVSLQIHTGQLKTTTARVDKYSNTSSMAGSGRGRTQQLELCPLPPPSPGTSFHSYTLDGPLRDRTTFWPVLAMPTRPHSAAHDYRAYLQTQPGLLITICRRDKRRIMLFRYQDSRAQGFSRGRQGSEERGREGGRQVNAS